MDKELKSRIGAMIKSSKVFLFMKGTPDEPQCGFSKRVVGILHDLNIQFNYFDVYSDEDVRQGMKEYSNWPTFPQLYVNGEFVGGCDITEQLASSGELKKLIA